MTPRKKQHNKWHKELVKSLESIQWCEICGTTSQNPQLQHAHRKKRYDIGWKTEENHKEYLMAAKLCQTCHAGLDENWNSAHDSEFDSHKIMYDVITNIVDTRLWP